MYRPTKRGGVWLVMDTVSGETHGPGHKNKQDCLRQCQGFVPAPGAGPITQDSSAVDMRAYLNKREIDQGDCRTTAELYHLITTGELPKKPKRVTRKPAAKAPAKPGKRPEKNDKDGLWHVFNMTTRHMYKRGYQTKAQCLEACKK